MSEKQLDFKRRAELSRWMRQLVELVEERGPRQPSGEWNINSLIRYVGTLDIQQTDQDGNITSVQAANINDKIVALFWNQNYTGEKYGYRKITETYVADTRRASIGYLISKKGEGKSKPKPKSNSKVNDQLAEQIAKLEQQQEGQGRHLGDLIQDITALTARVAQLEEVVTDPKQPTKAVAVPHQITVEMPKVPQPPPLPPQALYAHKKKI